MIVVYYSPIMHVSLNLLFLMLLLSLMLSSIKFALFLSVLVCDPSKEITRLTLLLSLSSTHHRYLLTTGNNSKKYYSPTLLPECSFCWQLCFQQVNPSTQIEASLVSRRSFFELFVYTDKHTLSVTSKNVFFVYVQTYD